jgi:uncharacterized protein
VKTFINQDAYLTEFNVHKKYATSELILDLVWTHCNIVADICLSLIQKNNLSNTIYHPGVVVQAALLHDIGVYICDGYEWLTNQPPFNKPYVQHTLAGAWILKQEGFSADVIQAAHVHAGVGITIDDIKQFGLQLPQGDYVPTTPVQRLVTYAAKFHSKAPKFKKTDEIRESLKKYGAEKIKVFDQYISEYGSPELNEIIRKYETWHQGFEYETSQLSNLLIVPNLNSAGIATRLVQ